MVDARRVRFDALDVPTRDRPRAAAVAVAALVGRRAGQERRGEELAHARDERVARGRLGAHVLVQVDPPARVLAQRGRRERPARFARGDESERDAVGDAAHGIHPIAGQGVNVGFRDVATLVEVLVDGKRLGMDLGDAQLLARYQRWRGLDTFMVALATDGLTRLFGVPGRAAHAVRRFGLSAVDRMPPLKGWFMSEARGESGDVPKLLQGMAA